MSLLLCSQERPQRGELLFPQLPSHVPATLQHKSSLALYMRSFQLAVLKINPGALCTECRTLPLTQSGPWFIDMGAMAPTKAHQVPSHVLHLPGTLDGIQSLEVRNLSPSLLPTCQHLLRIPHSVLTVGENLPEF